MIRGAFFVVEIREAILDLCGSEASEVKLKKFISV